MVSHLAPGPDFLGHITTGGHTPFAAHNFHSTPTSRAWPKGGTDTSNEPGSWQWTRAHTWALSPHVKQSPSRGLCITRLGGRTYPTSIPCPSRHPVHPAADGSAAPPLLAGLLPWGGCMDIGHD